MKRLTFLAIILTIFSFFIFPANSFAGEQRFVVLSEVRMQERHPEKFKKIMKERDDKLCLLHSVLEEWDRSEIPTWIRKMQERARVRPDEWKEINLVMLSIATYRNQEERRKGRFVRAIMGAALLDLIVNKPASVKIDPENKYSFWVKRKTFFTSSEQLLREYLKTRTREARVSMPLTDDDTLF